VRKAGRHLATIAPSTVMSLGLPLLTVARANSASPSVMVWTGRMLCAGLEQRLQRVFAQQIGPIASLLVRRVLKGATSREQFNSALADQTGDEVERSQLRVEIWRIGSPSPGRTT
jgi:hypothetical protein